MLLWFGRFDIVFWLSKVDFDVCFYTADLVVWLALSDVNEVLAATILNTDGVTFMKD